MPIKAFLTLLRLLSRDEANAKPLAGIRHYAITSVIWLTAAEVALITTAYPISLLCDTLISSEDDFVFGVDQHQAVWLIVALAIVIGLIEMFIHFKMSIQRNACEELLWKTLTESGNRHLKTLDQAWHDENGTTEKESLLTKNRDKLWDLVWSVIFSAGPGMIQAVLISAGLFLINWRLALVSIGMVLVYVVVVQKSSKRLNDMHEAYHNTWKAASDRASQDKGLMNTIIMLGTGQQRTKELGELLDNHYDKEIERFPVWLRVLSRQGYVLVVFFGLALLMAAESYWHGTSIGGVALSLGWLGRVSSNLFRLSELQHAVSRGGPALDELNVFFATQSRITAPPVPYRPAVVKGEVELDGIWFRYPGKKSWQLCEVSVHVPACTTVAMVGHSGSGKSTCIKLVPRLYDPIQGRVLIDGHDVREFDPEWLRSEVIGMVSQEVQMFTGTILDNITLGRTDLSFEEVMNAARMAHVTTFTDNQDKFPEGIYTQVGENGVKLSGGERVRVAMARVLVRRPPVILLDEAMASLDNKIERDIKEVFDLLMEQRVCTVMSIAHRLTTVKNADLILVFDDGEVKERGTHDELMALQGLYYELWESAKM